MPSTQYPSSFGRLQAISLSFLSKDFISSLIKAKDISEIAKMLESTWYGPEIERAASVYQLPELLEVALNRHLVEINKIALDVTPLSRKNAIKAYLLKWDIHNIALILSSKSVGKVISETEPFIVSSRNFPAGISAGNIPHYEIKIILSQTGVEGVVNHLAKYNYGPLLLRHLDEYQKTHSLEPMFTSLQNYYYQNLLDSLKFFQGDEGVIRELIRTEIDKKNILNLLKAKESNLDKELILRHIVEGGNISSNELMEIFGSKDVEDLVSRLESQLSLGQELEQYKKTKNLIDFEITFDKFITSNYVRKLRYIALSIGKIFHFLIAAEHERENIIRIAYGKRYNLSNERIEAMMLYE